MLLALTAVPMFALEMLRIVRNKSPMKQQSSRDHRSAIKSIFAPKSVALIGASDASGSVGCALTENLRDFKGRVHFINPRKPRVLGVATCAAIGEVSEPVDLAVV